MNQETERAPSQEQSAEELREILQIRRNKLSQLQADRAARMQFPSLIRSRV